MSVEIEQLQSIIDRLANNSRTRRVLEAGCGSLSHLKLDHAYVVGIDISEKQLARNGHLDEAIVGDIQTHDLPARSFDLIICWDVLEHLPEPEAALEIFAGAVSDGGLIVLALPNLFSIKGLTTKLTPHWFHVWAYRRFWGVEKAGTGDRAPFKTFLKLSVTPGAVKRFARDRGLEIEHFLAYESRMQKRLRKNHPPLNVGFALLGMLSKILSLGRLDASHSDYMMVLRRPAGSDAVPSADTRV
jgi:SAM-dependent methyltransferase